MDRKSCRLRQLAGLARGRVPGQLIIQLTDICNARCPQCGMRVDEKFPRTRLANEQVKRLLEAAIERGIQMLSFTGGEPMLLQDDLLELIEYAGELGFSYIRTGTNGYLFRNPQADDFLDRMSRLAARLAASPLRNFWISVDSAEPSIHERMRGFPGVIEGIAKVLPIFHDHGVFPSANVGLNRNMNEETAALPVFADGGDAGAQRFYTVYRRALGQLYRLLIDLGFTMTSACYPMSIQPAADGGLQSVYAATATDRVVNFTHWEKNLLYLALADSVEEFRDQIRIITPLSSLQALMGNGLTGSDVPYPCRGGIDYFFVDCRQGLTYPCGYRGNESLGHLWNLDIAALDSKRHCHACDWECFRDPSEVFGPILELFSSPIQLLGRCWRKKAALSRWWTDLRYAKACDFFDGRQPMAKERLRKFRMIERREYVLANMFHPANGQIPAASCPGKGARGVEK